MSVSSILEVRAWTCEWKKIFNSQLTVVIQDGNKEEMIINHQGDRKRRLQKHISLPEIRKLRLKNWQRPLSGDYTDDVFSGAGEDEPHQISHYNGERGSRLDLINRGLIVESDLQPVGYVSAVVSQVGKRRSHYTSIKKRPKSCSFTIRQSEYIEEARINRSDLLFLSSMDFFPRKHTGVGKKWNHDKSKGRRLKISDGKPNVVDEAYIQPTVIKPSESTDVSKAFDEMSINDVCDSDYIDQDMGPVGENEIQSATSKPNIRKSNTMNDADESFVPPLVKSYMSRKQRLLRRCASVAALTPRRKGQPFVRSLVNMYEPVNGGWRVHDNHIYDTVNEGWNLYDKNCENRLPRTLSLDRAISGIIEKNGKAELSLGKIKLLFDD